MTHSATTPHPDFPLSRSLLEKSERHIAGGVVSLNRKTDPPIAFVKGQGSRLTDADGNVYIDYHGAFAPMLLGHNHPEISAAVQQCLQDGWSLTGSGPTPWEQQFAELFCESVPTVERIQVFNTGSEATANAIRFSRAVTGRDDIITTLGGYNGWHDEVGRAVMPSLDEIGPRRSADEYPLIPISAGIPKTTQQRIHTVNFNDLESVEAVMKSHNIACVITEPVLQNIGVVPPTEGYLSGLKSLCEQYGALLVLDEVKTGFRTALGGYQSIAGVTADLSVYGKAAANGYPLAVLGGRADVMERVQDPDPSQRVLVAGTYNGHPIPTSAAIATLKILGRDKGAVYRELESRTDRLLSGIEAIVAEFGLTATLSRNASAFCLYFMDHIPHDWHDILEHHDFEFDKRYRRALIDRGIYHFPLACKQGSVSAAHSDDDIDETLEKTRDALRCIS
jgi:glutamate-1-semialdehyde 2,1-aminomutase